MRHFHSYGPVDSALHFCVDRKDLIEQCTERLYGDPEKGGHYFTIWAPRQTGKTWLMRKTIEKLSEIYGARFQIGALSMQGGVLSEDDPCSDFLRQAPRLMRNGFGIANLPQPSGWDEWLDYFHRAGGLFEKPVVLFIDEFDNLPASVIDRLVALFREMYLDRKNYLLHALALVGVRAVLGGGKSQRISVQYPARHACAEFYEG